MDKERLNNEQRDAVYADAHKMLCLAGAGCGKTYSMITRICRLVETGVTASSILVLTFTNAAALEMETRYMSKRPDDVLYPNFRTFHSFCYSLLVTDLNVRCQLGYTSIPTVASDAETKEIEKLAAEQSGIKLSTSKLQTASTFIQDTLKKTIRRIMNKRGLITFDMMCYDVCQLFKEDAPCIQRYKQHYKYIFVDEFQDTDLKQWEFVSSFKDSDIFVVADALQAIYAFRGADSSIVKGLADDPDWYKVKLTYNYRSTSQICQFANQHSDHGEESYRVKIHSNKEGPEVSCRFYSEEDTLQSIILECNQLHVENGGTCAILCRTNAEVNQIAQMCKSLHIDAITKDAEIDTTIAILRSVKDEQYAVTWLASKLKAASYSTYLRRAYIQPYTLAEFVQEFVSDPSSYIMEYVEKIQSWNQKLAEIASADDMNRFISMIGPRRLAENLEIHKRSELIDALISLYDDRDNSKSILSLYVGTIHSVKGLEYDSVMLLNVGGKSFRLTNEENKNLYYVGITRARDHLYIWKGDIYNEGEF